MFSGLSIAVSLLVAGAPSAPARDGEWAKGISYTLDWDQAIKEVKQSGKMLFVVNGWERSGI